MRCRYWLEEILLTALCAVLFGVDDWETMTLWGRSQLAWLRKLLPYENGVPSPDTLRRVFAALNPVLFDPAAHGALVIRRPIVRIAWLALTAYLVPQTLKGLQDQLRNTIVLSDPRLTETFQSLTEAP